MQLQVVNYETKRKEKVINDHCVVNFPHEKSVITHIDLSSMDEIAPAPGEKKLFKKCSNDQQARQALKGKWKRILVLAGSLLLSTATVTWRYLCPTFVF